MIEADNYYDPKCYDLAKYFLDSEPCGGSKDELARRIQKTVEDYYREKEERG